MCLQLELVGNVMMQGEGRAHKKDSAETTHHTEGEIALKGLKQVVSLGVDDTSPSKPLLHGHTYKTAPHGLVIASAQRNELICLACQLVRHPSWPELQCL